MMMILKERTSWKNGLTTFAASASNENLDKGADNRNHDETDANLSLRIQNFISTLPTNSIGAIGARTLAD